MRVLGKETKNNMKKLVKKAAPKSVAAYGKLSKKCNCSIKCYINKGFTSASKIPMQNAQNGMNKWN